MNYVVKLFPEITLKSASLRRRYITALQINIHTILSSIDQEIKVLREWDRLVVQVTPSADQAALVDALGRISGIQKILAVRILNTFDPEVMLTAVRTAFGSQLNGKTFAVQVKRSGSHEFTSLGLARRIGGALLDEFPSCGVDLDNPQLPIRLEVNSKNTLLVEAEYPGLGGYPVGTQEEVLSLISGGFDSAVASMQLIKRGCKVHYCFFNLGGAQHSRGVKQMAVNLWQRYGASHRVRFFEVNFAQVLAQILERIPVGNQGVVLKRSMLRVADSLAQRWEIPALVTGEALGQVSSQTLTNLNAIDRASETVVLRPLVSWDKPDIIDMARRIGVAELAASIPEFCAAISSNPNARVKLTKVELDEERLDADILQNAIDAVQYFDIKDLMQELETAAPLTELLTELRCVANSQTDTTMSSTEDVLTDVLMNVIIDVRPDAQNSTLAPQLRKHSKLNIQHIPYYRILTEFAKLDQSKNYFLYCDKGVMSGMQVAHLRERGFSNVQVWQQ
ncbi:tRNA uracil 4-sulfurtransferase ThiI [Undibacterium flavidum]|uniref:tRNA sulfurtransferase n=1 Tax=Undibacterium flavidum TaxID=2762297 RepID=A0ABR6YG46_9BURK|nr:tRNA uracil 4-sulfurtransferase ThiI [Undibacterium flavidum]MBC3875556.1 tRNA 4-thiouridine(8) synthase ThiI [Undibacterium flavidum]